jgi:hypothetical protein
LDPTISGVTVTDTQPQESDMPTTPALNGRGFARIILNGDFEMTSPTHASPTFMRKSLAPTELAVINV